VAGSSHDARVFKNALLGETLINNPQGMISKNLHILGDSENSGDFAIQFIMILNIIKVPEKN